VSDNAEKPGDTGQPLDDQDRVLRLGLIPSDLNKGFVSANVFSLSTEEKQTPPHWLSVWQESLTTDEQAYAMATNKNRRLVIRLTVHDIRGIRIEAAGERSLLDAVWDRLEHVWDEDGNLRPDTPAGAAGHCGITGLHGIHRKQLRKRLADLTSQPGSWSLLPEQGS